MAEKPIYTAMSDFVKVEFLEEQLRGCIDELREKHGEVRSVRDRLEASQADAYDFQKKSQQLESENKTLREDNRRLGREGEEEIRRLMGMMKRLDVEKGKLLKVVGNKEEAIERIRRQRDRDIRDKDLEIQELEETLLARNDEVNALKETCDEQKARIKTLEHHVDIEKRTADNYKEAAEKYEAAAPALERLNKILAKYLGDHLQDGFDWPPGHPNNKMNKAFDALEDELAKANKKGTTTAAAPITTEETTRTISENRFTLFPPTEASTTDSGNMSLKEQLQANITKRDKMNQSRSDGDSFADFAGNRQSKTSEFKDAMSNAFKGRRDHENEFIPESPLEATPSKGTKSFGPQITPGQKTQRPGLNTNLPNNARNFSLFQNGISATEDDSPKPSEKVFGDFDPKKRPSRFTNRLVPMAEPEIVYRDREVIKWRDCDRHHTDKPVECERLHADEIESPTCSRLHVEDCPYEHVDDTEDGEREPVVEYRDREVIKEVRVEVPVECEMLHAVDLGPCPKKHAEDVGPCERKHEEDLEPEYIEVPVPCNRPHVDDRTAKIRPTKGLAIQTDMTRHDISEFVRLANQTPTAATPTVKIEEKIVEKPVEKIVYKDKIIEKEKIVEKKVEVIKYVDKPVVEVQTKYQDRVVWRPRHPMKTIFYFYFDLWVCLVEWAWRWVPSAVTSVQNTVPKWAADYLIMKPLAGHKYEMVHEENDVNSFQMAKHSILKRVHGEASVEKKEEDLMKAINKNSANGKSKGPLSPPASTIGLNKANGKATANGATNGTATNGAASKDSKEHYITATQYIVKRPLFVSNLIMAVFFTALIPFVVASLILWGEYTDLLDYNGVVRPSWFTLPFQGDGLWARRQWDDCLFIVDREWSWLYYMWRGLTGGWAKQVHFYLQTTASGGAGFRMPG